MLVLWLICKSDKYFGQFIILLCSCYCCPIQLVSVFNLIHLLFVPDNKRRGKLSQHDNKNAARKVRQFLPLVLISFDSTSNQRVNVCWFYLFSLFAKLHHSLVFELLECTGWKNTRAGAENVHSSSVVIFFINAIYRFEYRQMIID